jgi:transketolase
MAFKRILSLKKLALQANTIRSHIISMTFHAGSGHPGGALGMADIMTYLYFNVLKHNPLQPKDPKRDFFFLSNAHTCPVLYATLAECGYFSKLELKNLRKLGSKLQGHPHLGSVPGVEASGGPLGQGISQAVGLAAVLKREKKPNRVFCYVGDGELEEGQCWEALLFAQKEQLDNLVVIVDWNHIQIDGDPDDVIGLGDLGKKFRAFDWRVIEIDGNSLPQIAHAFKALSSFKVKKPTCILAKTIPGKGVSFMENKHEWHGKAPNEEEMRMALQELNEERKKFER